MLQFTYLGLLYERHRVLCRVVPYIMLEDPFQNFRGLFVALKTHHVIIVFHLRVEIRPQHRTIF